MIKLIAILICLLIAIQAYAFDLWNNAGHGFSVGSGRLTYDLAEGATLGPELVANGTFDVDISSWTGIAATLALNANRIDVAANSGSNGFAYQAVTTTIGKMYLFEGEKTAISEASQFALGVGIGQEEYYGSAWSAGNTAPSITFTATSSTTYITCYVAPNTGRAYFDNITLKEIFPVRLP